MIHWCSATTFFQFWLTQFIVVQMITTKQTLMNTALMHQFTTWLKTSDACFNLCWNNDVSPSQ